MIRVIPFFGVQSKFFHVRRVTFGVFGTSIFPMLSALGFSQQRLQTFSLFDEGTDVSRLPIIYSPNNAQKELEIELV